MCNNKEKFLYRSLDYRWYKLVKYYVKSCNTSIQFTSPSVRRTTVGTPIKTSDCITCHARNRFTFIRHL